MNKLYTFLLTILLGMNIAVCDAQNFSYKKRFFFKLDKYDIDEGLRDNRAVIDSTLWVLRNLKNQGASNIQIHITSFASLEASDAYNAKLTFNRTQSLKSFLSKFVLVDPNSIVIEDNVFDWELLYEQTSHSNCPYREEALYIMRTEPSTVSTVGNMRKEALRKLGKGVTYEYMRQNFFPEMRNSMINITANVPVEKPATRAVVSEPVEVAPVEHKTFPHRGMFAIRTNVLADIAALPNIGVELYVADHWSVGANWMYSWWKTDKTHKYWRAYGGDVRGEYWFSNDRLWKGHHVGVYANMATYDFEWKSMGYQGPKWSYGGGLSYGYALCLTKHISLDFNIALGYFGGKYYTYDPSEERGIYYHRETKHLNWVGPTRAEASFIWKIGKEKPAKKK